MSLTPQPSLFLVVCDHATLEIEALTATEAKDKCRCRICRFALEFRDGKMQYGYKDVRIYISQPFNGEVLPL